jgi:predicted CXXCH cytochrome family protein
MRFLKLASLAAACGAVGCADAKTPAAASASVREAHAVASNVLRADYAGSASCEPCHPAIHAAFMKSPMHRMTRRVEGSEVHAPFDGRTFRFKGDTVTLEEHDGRRYMKLESLKSGSRLFQITKVIGGRYREDFVGRPVATMQERDGTAASRTAEQIMPVSWLLFEPGFRYKGYSVMVRERGWLEPGMVWRETCIFCHNTAPRLASLYDDLLPDAGKYQGSVSERFLPPSRTWKIAPAGDDALVRAVADEVAALGAPRPTGDVREVLGEAMRETRERFEEKNLIELGIGCEACHNGSKEHTEHPERRPSFEIRSRFLRVETPATKGAEPTHASFINRTCARCHTVLFSEYPYTWEGGLRSQSPGGSHINSGEARDFILGGCADRMACPTCHDPHAGSRPEKLEELGTVSGNRLCTGCHSTFATEDALRKHTHHQPIGAGSACLGCHMPKKNMGLAYKLTRYHRIGSPNDAARVEGDRPLECALCHADQSVKMLVDTMEHWWGRRFDRAKLRALYGRLEAKPLVATVAYGKPHEVATAVAVLGERGGPEAIPFIATALTSAYPLVRYFARRALEHASGRPVTIDVEEDTERIEAALKAWQAAGEATGDVKPR